MSPEPQREEDPGGDHATPEDIELTRVVEREKTIGIVWVGFFITIGVVTVVIGVVKALDKPPWLVALTAILTALFGPSGVVALVIRSRRRYVQKTQSRTAELEKRIDP